MNAVKQYQDAIRSVSIDLVVSSVTVLGGTCLNRHAPADSTVSIFSVLPKPKFVSRTSDTVCQFQER